MMFEVVKIYLYNFNCYNKWEGGIWTPRPGSVTELQDSWQNDKYN